MLIEKNRKCMFMYKSRAHYNHYFKLKTFSRH